MTPLVCINDATGTDLAHHKLEGAFPFLIRIVHSRLLLDPQPVGVKPTSLCVASSLCVVTEFMVDAIGPLAGWREATMRVTSNMPLE
jgi:hypothetical protein